MKASCHRCGRDYLTARAMAGKPVTCRSCGAQNDGAGGPPPPQETPKQKGRSAPPDKVRIESGAAFTVGGGPPEVVPRSPVDPRAGDMRSIGAPIPVPRPAVNSGGGAMPWVAFGGALAAVLLLGLGLFWMMGRQTAAPSNEAASQGAAAPSDAAASRASAGPVAWSTLQKAVPLLAGSGGTGSGFLIERSNRIWLVTNFHVIDGEERMEAVFWNPGDGSEMFRIPLDVEDFRVHPDFRQSRLDADSENDFDLAVCDVTSHRHTIAGNGITPLRVSEDRADRQGESVRALGHPGTKMFSADAVDERAKGLQPHAIVKGVLSKVFREQKPDFWRTDAALAPGFSGGPLVLEGSQEVVAINTFYELEDNGSKKAGADYCLSARHANEAIDRGVPLKDIRGQLAAAVRGSEGRVADFVKEEVEKWPTWPVIDDVAKFYGEQGFALGASIVTTDAEGDFEYSFEVPAPGPRIVDFAIVPEDPLVQVQIFPFLDSARRDLGSVFTSKAAEPAVIRPADPLSGEELPIEAGVSLLPTVSTRFCGQPIPARCLLIVCHKPVEVGADVGAIPQRSAAPPSSTRGPVASGTGIAAKAEAQSGMAPDVYASSLVGLRRFDENYLSSLSQDDCYERMFAKMNAYFDAEGSSAISLKDDPAFFRDIMHASLVSRIYSRGLWASRPLFEVHVKAPEATKVGVYLDLDPSFRRFLPLPQGGLVSSRADVPLVESDPRSGVRYEPDMDAYRIALNIPWNGQELLNLTQPVEIPYSLRVEYGDGSSDLIAGQTRVMPVTQVEHLYPWGLGVAAMVDESHPWVKRIIDDINQQKLVKDSGLVLAGGGGDASDQLMSIFLVWRELASRGIRYQNLTAAEGVAQRCRMVHESLATANANCLDGTVLLASFLEAMGIDTYLVLVPGHALLAAWVGEDLMFFETTQLGKAIDAEERAYEHESSLFKQLRSKHRLLAGGEFEAFEFACVAGSANADGALEEAKPVLAEYREMAKSFEKRSSDPEWIEKFGAAIDRLGRQIQLIPISFARDLGVRPVGHPPDLDTRFKLPPRR